MSTSGAREGVRLSTIFVPGPNDPVVHKERNCTPPTRIGPGHYQTTTPNLGVAVASVTTHATNAAGQNRFVTARLVVVGTSATIDVFIRDTLDAPTDDALFVECTIDALPLS